MWAAEDCRTAEGVSRVYLGCDGVQVPLVTEEEKQKRRTKIREKRRHRGRCCRPLPRPKTGADQTYKKFKVANFYDETMKHRYENMAAHVAKSLIARKGIIAMLEVSRALYRDGYKVWIEFNDGVSGVVDLTDALWGPMFEPLKELDDFKRFVVSEDLHTIIWENGADLAPEYLYEKMSCHAIVPERDR